MRIDVKALAKPRQPIDNRYRSSGLLMYICLCNGITDRDIRRCVREGSACCVADLQRELGVATQCGRCETHARELIDQEATATAAVC